MSAVVSDTSPLHYLVECEAIGILPALFGEVLIEEVMQAALARVRSK